MPLRPRAGIEKLELVPHGGPDLAELRARGISPEDVLDFSVSSNPFPPPPAVEEAVNSRAITSYPDSEATELRQSLSEKLAVPADNILCGNGSMEIIRLISLAYFGQGDKALIIEPTFGEYEVSCRIAGAEVFSQRREAENGFALDVDETVELIRAHQPSGIFLCNPNSPTGDYLSRREVEKILDGCENSLLVLDEAFIAFVDGAWTSIDLIQERNVVIVRSMTKDYGLAGLRLGYAVARREIIDMLRRVRPPWNVNVIAQRAGVAALASAGYIERCKRDIEEAKQFLTGELLRAGFKVVPSRTNFFLVKVGDAVAFRAALLEHGILVRDCASFGLPEYVRIAVRPVPECRRLIDAVRAVKREGEKST